MKLTRNQTFFLVTAISAVLMLVLAYVFVGKAPPQLSAYGVDISQTSVSGVSSGGAMAVQMHIAHSSIMKGAGVISGVAYNCADSRLSNEDLRLHRGYFTCMPGLPNSGGTAQFSIDRTTEAWISGGIDNPLNLEHDKVWLFRGAKDTSILNSTMDGLDLYYRNYVKVSNVFYKTDISAPHAHVTDEFELPCNPANTDHHIANCEYDAAGYLLQHIYGSLSVPDSGTSSKVPTAFDQTEFVGIVEDNVFTNVKPRLVGLAKTGYVYVPDACETDTCRVHVVFHGCTQYASNPKIGKKFVNNAGYNEWADENRLIILYPQTRGTPQPFNPLGCWDWWGYSNHTTHDTKYALKLGYQIAAVRRMLSRLAENYSPSLFSRPSMKPRHLRSDSTNTSVELFWESNNAARSSNVYRRQGQNGSFVKINTDPVYGASFVDRSEKLRSETTYQYRVTIFNWRGLESNETSEICVTTSAPPKVDDEPDDDQKTRLLPIHKPPE